MDAIGADATRLLDTLVAQAVVRCPRCTDGDLVVSPGAVRCPHCGSAFPERNGMVDFLEYREEGEARTGPPSPAIVQAIIDGTGLENSPRIRRAVEEVWARTSRGTASFQQTAEIRDLLDRFGISTEDPSTSAATAESFEPARSRWRRLFGGVSRPNRDVGVAYQRHYFGAQLLPGQTVHRNIRLCNVGASTWSSTVDHPLLMSYRWLADGRAVVKDGRRTAFPIDIDSGRAITLPLMVTAPPDPGRYVLRIMPVEEGRRWLRRAVLDIHIEVTPRCPPTDGNVTTTPEFLSYAADHSLGQEMLRSYIRRRYGDRRLRLLEIGSGTHPQAPWVGDVEVVSLDVSAPMAELGSLHYEQHAGRVTFLCGDALNPPLADGAFDGVVMFATLHHFAEPEVLLQRAARLLAHDGFMAVMCEPVATSLPSEGVRDLLKGIDEQVFSLDEYLAIFARAELALDEGRLDGGSLKVVLGRAGAAAAVAPAVTSAGVVVCA